MVYFSKSGISYKDGSTAAPDATPPLSDWIWFLFAVVTLAALWLL